MSSMARQAWVLRPVGRGGALLLALPGLRPGRPSGWRWSLSSCLERMSSRAEDFGTCISLLVDLALDGWRKKDRRPKAPVFALYTCSGFLCKRFFTLALCHCLRRVYPQRDRGLASILRDASRR